MLKRGLGIGLAALLAAAFVIFAPTPEVCTWDFRGSLWGPAYMLLHGHTPYTFDTPYGPYPGIWMPQLVGAFLPIGLLPCPIASKMWFLLELSGLFLIMWLVSGKKLPSPLVFGIALLMIFLYPPLYIHLQIGQISIFTMLLILLVVFQYWGQDPLRKLAWWMPLFLALALAKPQLGVLVYPGLLVGMFRDSGTRGAARLILSTAAWVVGLMLPLFLLDPGWLKGFLEITLGNTQVAWDLPNPMVQLRVSLGPFGLVLWGLIFLGCLAFTLWLWWRHDPRLAVLWSLALTPIATPYCSSWDFMLIIPLLIWLLVHLQSHLARGLLVAGVFVISGLQVAMRWNTHLPDGRNWWVPPALLLVVGLSLVVEQARKGRVPVTMWQELPAA